MTGGCNRAALRALALALALVASACGSAHRVPPPPPPRPPPVPGAPRILVVMLDAVPFEAVAALPLAADGERPFAELSEPVPLISSFPSATTVALTAMFESIGIARPPGYEARYFDREQDEVVGGGLLSYQQIPFSWREFFDWKVRGLLRKAWGYVRPRRFARWEVRHGVQAFLESDLPYYFVYVGATDGVAHLAGPAGFDAVFLELDAALDAARRQEEFHTVLLSDHGVGGGPKLVNVEKAVRRALRAGGLEPRQRLRDGDDVALVPFGLLSGFVAFAPRGRELEVAERIATVAGVEVCAVPGAPSDSEQEAWSVVSADGRARVGRRERGGVVEWRYRAERGDPLGYGDLAGPWQDDAVWYQAVADRRLPDALHRIDRGFDLVGNPASLLCSVAPGHMYGATATDLTSRFTVGRLRWTHGGLGADDSLGFFMTDHPALRAAGPAAGGALRVDRALEGLGTPPP
ncbi:MAG TPA: hypothetical protein VMV46_01720 [Thermoanaerobaculia bacterium]|nr:hypothetical protein [Thermoanaerobaculia bacterium]